MFSRGLVKATLKNERFACSYAVEKMLNLSPDNCAGSDCGCCCLRRRSSLKIQGVQQRVMQWVTRGTAEFIQSRIPRPGAKPATRDEKRKQRLFHHLKII